MAKVIVPYSRNRIGLAIITSLSKAGHEVWAADSIPIAMGGLSRFAKRFIRYPDPWKSEHSREKFAAWATEKIRQSYIIFPTFMESWVLKDLGIGDIPLPAWDVIRRANSKFAVHQLCVELGIPTPQTMYIADGVIKPVDGRGALGRYYVKNAIIQERVYGDPIGVGMLFNSGKLKAKFSWRRLAEYPSDGGTSIIRESICATEQEKYAERLLRALNWHGVAMVEFKGEHVLEINPRFWGSLKLAIDSNVDFPRLLLEMMLTGDCAEVFNWELGVKTSWLGGCLLRRCLPQGKLEDLNWDDPLPFFGQFMTVAYNLVRGKGLVLDEH